MGFMGKELNEWIEIKLRERGWSISELARQADLNNSFVSHVLSGRANPGPKFYQGMARAFDLPISIIEQLDKEGVVPDDEQRLSISEWTLLLKQLTPAQRFELLKYGFELLRGSPDDETSSDVSRAKEAPQTT